MVDVAQQMMSSLDESGFSSALSEPRPSEPRNSTARAAAHENNRQLIDQNRQPARTTCNSGPLAAHDERAAGDQETAGHSESPIRSRGPKNLSVRATERSFIARPASAPRRHCALGSRQISSVRCTFYLTDFGSRFRRGLSPFQKSAPNDFTATLRCEGTTQVFESQFARLRPGRATTEGRKGGAYIVGMSKKANLQSLSDDELLRRVSELLGQSRRSEADLVAHIAEVEARRLYAREAVPSMFAWCTEVLHLSDYEAYLRITVARASRKHPILLIMLRDGRLHLSGIAKLAPHLTPANRETLLKRATHKTKRQLEELIAELAPRPETPSAIRKLPARRAETPPSPTGGLGLDRVESSSPAPQLATAPPELGPDRVAASQASSKATARRRWSHSRRPATRSSSPPAPSSATSWSGSRR